MDGAVVNHEDVDLSEEEKEEASSATRSLTESPKRKKASKGIYKDESLVS
jgi:hypothetical protein